MSHFRKLMALLIVGLFSQTALAADDAINTGFFNNTAIDGYDTVAYFTQSKAVKGNKQHSLSWRGAEWRFSSQQNLDLFKADPEKYAPQYGGWCAYAMADEGNTVRIDGEAWDILEGKLYLNYSKSVQTKWHKKQLDYIQQADKFYPLTTNVSNY